MAQSFVLAAMAGLRDSISPGGLTAMLILGVFLFFLAKKGQKIGPLGIGFIFGVGSARAGEALGIWEHIVMSRAFDMFLDTVYFVIAIFAISIGGICLRDWWILKRDKDESRTVIKFFSPGSPLSGENGPGRNGSRRKGLRWVKVLVSLALSFGCGMLLAFIESAWPPDAEMLLMLYQKMIEGKLWLIFVLTFLYGVAFVVLLGGLLGAVCFVRRRQRLVSRLRDSLSKVQIITSAVFFAYGIALLRYYV